MLPICLTKLAAYEWINKHPRFSSYMTSIFKTFGLDSFSSVLRKLFCSQSASVCLSTIFAGTYRMNLKSLKFVSMDLHLHTKSLKLQYKSIVKKLSHGNLYLKHARSNWLNSFVFICRSSSFLMQWTLTQYLGIFPFLCILINWHCRQRTGIAPSDMIRENTHIFLSVSS